MRDAGGRELCNLQPTTNHCINNSQLFMVSRSVIWISRNINNLFLDFVFNYWLLETEQRLNVFAFYFLLFGFLVWLVSIANILRWEYEMLWIVNWIIAAWAGEGIMRPLLWARSGLTAQAARPRQWPGLKSVQWQPQSVAESRVLLQRRYWV